MVRNPAHDGGRSGSRRPGAASVSDEMRRPGRRDDDVMRSPGRSGWDAVFRASRSSARCRRLHRAPWGRNRLIRPSFTRLRRRPSRWRRTQACRHGFATQVVFTRRHSFRTMAAHSNSARRPVLFVKMPLLRAGENTPVRTEIQRSPSSAKHAAAAWTALPGGCRYLDHLPDLPVSAGRDRAR